MRTSSYVDMRQLQGSGPRLGPRMMWLVSVAPNVIVSPPPSDPLHRLQRTALS